MDYHDEKCCPSDFSRSPVTAEINRMAYLIYDEDCSTKYTISIENRRKRRFGWIEKRNSFVNVIHEIIGKEEEEEIIIYSYKHRGIFYICQELILSDEYALQCKITI